MTAYKKSIDYRLSTINVKNGFSLIELMVVISLFAITTIAVTISYISFEGQQQVKNAALSLQSDLRAAQNSAQNGDIVDTISCPRDSSHHLYGWYVYLKTALPTSYTLSGDCLTDPSTETAIGTKYVNLPSGVSICTITYNSASKSQAAVLFKPLSYTAALFDPTTLVLPAFLDTSGALVTLSGASPDELVVTLTSSDGSYQVHVTASGDIFVKQIATVATCS